MRRSTTLLFLMLASPSLAGTIDTAAGNGRAGSAGDGGQARSAMLVEPFHCEFDRRGALLIADAPAGKIRRLDLTTGLISGVAGDGSNGLGRESSPALEATIGTPYALASDPETGDLYIVDQQTPVVRKLDGKSGLVSIIAGTGKKGSSGDGAAAKKAMLREPNDCCLDGKGGLLIADVGDWRVRRVDLKSGLITTFAGTGRPARRPDRSEIGDGGPAKDAVIVGARAVCVDARGNVYLCEREGNSIRKVDASGLISTLAGTGAEGYSGDGGPALLATFRGPKGIRADGDGNLFVVDTENHAIRRIDAKSGLITTVAGGRKGSEGDGGDATKAGLDRPHGCVVGPDGSLYIADSNNHRVRRVTPR